MSLSSRLRHLLDRFGATGSMLCALHCAVIPVLLAAAPSLGLSFWLSDGVEQALVVFVTLLGLFSLVWGYRRHGALRALGFLIPGLVALGALPYLTGAGTFMAVAPQRLPFPEVVRVGAGDPTRFG